MYASQFTSSTSLGIAAWDCRKAGVATSSVVHSTAATSCAGPCALILLLQSVTHSNNIFESLTCVFSRFDDSTLNNNLLNGTIPSTIGSLTSLQILYVRAPMCGQSNLVLSLIDDISFPYPSYVEFNELTGTVPSTIGSLTSLQILYVNAHWYNDSLLVHFSYPYSLWMWSYYSIESCSSFSNRWHFYGAIDRSGTINSMERFHRPLDRSPVSNICTWMLTDIMIVCF